MVILSDVIYYLHAYLPIASYIKMMQSIDCDRKITTHKSTCVDA